MSEKKGKSADSGKQLNEYPQITPEEEEKQAGKLVRFLIAPHKTVRDPVHKDIFITHLETMLIDTSVMQRIRRLRQLGLTYLVYPGANHTRFEHSLGTLFMADRMIDNINKNPYCHLIIGDDDRFIIRLCALLHDMDNIPFGHTLEDEGKLFDRQGSAARMEYFFSNNSEIGKIILNYPSLKELEQLNKARFKPGNVLKELKETLSAIENKKVDQLTRPYIGDIVGNTICADLLDYSKRDIYFTGLTSGYDERFLSYLYVTKYNDKYRLVLRLIKPKTGKIRRDVLSEVMDLLRLRYSIAEKVYYHSTKMIASAMLISAVTSLAQENRLSAEMLYGMDDETLLKYLSSFGTAISQHLISHLRSRRLYKIAYDLSYSEEGISQDESQQKMNIIRELSEPTNRYEKERLLERMSSCSSVMSNNSGSIVIYCPTGKMGMKEVEALVDWGSGKSPLKDVEEFQDEIKTTITDKHRKLWRLLVLVDPEIPDVERCYVNGDCEELFGLPSSSKQYIERPHRHYIERYAEKLQKEEPNVKLLQQEVQTVRSQLPTWGQEKPKVITYQQFCREINDLRINSANENKSQS